MKKMENKNKDRLKPKIPFRSRYAPVRPRINPRDRKYSQPKNRTPKDRQKDQLINHLFTKST